MKKPNKTITILCLVLSAALAVLGYLVTANQTLKHQVAAKSTENIQYRNKYGELVSEKLSFEGTKNQMKAEIESWKKGNDTLRGKVTSSTKAIVYLKKELLFVKSGKPVEFIPGKTDTLIMIDTIRIDTPSYVVKESDKWHEFNFAGNKSKYAYSFRVTDNTELHIDKAGKLGTIVRAINPNPYVIKSEAKSVTIPPNKTSFIHKAVHAAGIALIGYLLIIR